MLASSWITAVDSALNVPRVGWIWSGRSSYDPNEAKGFRQGLRELGYTEGQNISVIYRFGEGSEDRLKEFVDEFLRLPVDVIVALGIPSVRAVQQTGTKIPVV